MRMYFCRSCYNSLTHSTQTYNSPTYTSYEFMSCYSCRRLLYLR